MYVEDMGSKAKALFESGYNCSQAVFVAFADELGIDTELAAKISSPFGGGMGRLREVCGTVSGMFMVLGMKYGYSDPSVFTAKKELYARVQELAGAFKDKNGSIICRELLGLSPKSPVSPVPEERTPEYYRKRPCGELVKAAAEIVQDYIEKHP